MERSTFFTKTFLRQKSQFNTKCDQDSHVLESEEVTNTLILYSIYVFYVEDNNNKGLIVVSSRHAHALRG